MATHREEDEVTDTGISPLHHRMEPEVIEEEEEEEEEDQNWDDWEAEDEAVGDASASESQLRCLFCDYCYSSCSSLFEHCASVHCFDFGEIKRSLGLDFYQCFKLINYIRSQVSEDKCWSCGMICRSKEELRNHLHKTTNFERNVLPWNDDGYLNPFLRDDALLYSFGEEDEDEDGDAMSIDKEELETYLSQIESVSIREIGVSDKHASNFMIPCENGGKEVVCMFDKDVKGISPERAVLNGASNETGGISSHGNWKNEMCLASSSEIAANEIKNTNKNYFGAYSSYGIHREMISDKARTDAYRQAILENPSLLRNAVVMDVGCGTGILSLFAAKAGASKVIAVEASEKMAAVASQVAKDNGLLLTRGEISKNGVIEVVPSMVEELYNDDHIQPHSIDVLLSEWMGYCLLYESMLSSVLFARDQWLKPGGAILPDTATMFVAGFGRGGTSLPFWENVYGFKMSCIGQEIVEDASRFPIIDVIDSINIITTTEVLQPYIVYMGSSSDADGGDDSSHLQMISSLIPSEESERKFLLNSYNHAFRGFSAMLRENEASVLSGYDEVVSVFPDPVLELHTTRSWDFLEARDSKFRSKIPFEHNSADVIIGVIDTGIWPESPSFDDNGIVEIPSKWKGVCMEGSDFNKSNCNRKLIGARYYTNKAFVASSNETNPTQTRGSPRDIVGHGTHTASIAGGARVTNASYYGLAKGTLRGGLPSARIASYKACTLDGCAGSIILKAIDDAIKDGVDIISISIGVSSIFQSDFLNDPIAIGSFHAEQLGIMVVCSAGNDGPDSYTVVNSAPWIFTVAASTIDRVFESRILLGNNKSFEGAAINFSPLSAGKQYPLAFGGDVASSFTLVSDARNCMPGSIDYKKAAGKIVVCVNDDPMVSRRIKKLVVEDAKAKGMILIDSEREDSPLDSGTYPFAQVGQSIGSQLLHYINSTKNPTATILASEEIRNFKPAPVVSTFSSRGPGSLTENILKPDIMAPGVAILAATVPRIDSSYGAPGNKSSLFGIRSGTSMACPHVTGAMAFIKSIHPQWTSSVIKSALMTTASMFNNIGKPLTNSTSDYPSNPHETGVGEIFPTKALDPGLAFETTTNDHLNFLCYYGYKNQVIKSMSHKNFSCPRKSNQDFISNINYPTISIGRLNRADGPRRIKRFATNLGSPNATYVSSINAPRGLQVEVHPRKLVFTQGMKRASFKVFFHGKEASKGYKYGDIRWFDGIHIVRVVFAVNVE